MVKLYLCLAKDCGKLFFEPNEDGNCPFCGCNRIEQIEGRVDGNIIAEEHGTIHTLSIPDTYLEEALEKWKEDLKK